jgi:hypothetical protein
MRDYTQSEHKAAESQTDGGSFKTDATNSSAEPTENQNAGGESVAGCPAQENDDSNQCYNGESHKFTERQRVDDDQVPSAGWREVYFSMGVDVR